MSDKVSIITILGEKMPYITNPTINPMMRIRQGHIMNLARFTA
jgi:hypothetical protein